MATNENGHLLDTAGNVAVDFVWGNFPLQPNDVREENGGELLDADLDNHSIAYEGWNGYPLFNPDLDGDGIIDGSEGAEGAGFIVIPSVIGLTTANATDVLEDAGLVVTVGSAASQSAKTVTAISRTAGETTISATATGHGFPVGATITISNTGSAAANGTYTVLTAPTTGTFTASGTATTVLALTEITGSAVGTTGTVKTQSVAAGADEKAVGDAITIVAYAAAS
jgi:hypothetical protein